MASFHSIQKKGGIKQSKVWNYDYIELGKEFTARNFKDGFVVMREFFIGLGEREKIRNGKSSAWSVDLTVIDLPTGKRILYTQCIYLTQNLNTQI